jgi:hypothetical protein
MPRSAFVRANSSVVFSAVACGTPPLAYQWQFNGTNLLNQTNASLALANVQPTNSGLYSLVITNAFGLVTTNTSLWVGQFAFNTAPTNLAMCSNGFQLTLGGIVTTNPVILLSSSDLVNWAPVLTNPPTTGSVQFLDLATTNTPARFYRARE